MRPLPRIEDIMTREVVTVTPEMDLLRAMHLLLYHCISGMPVVDTQGRLLGMLSQKDCLRAALHAGYHAGQDGLVGDAMHAPVDCLTPDLDILSAAERFLSGPYRRFPVMDGARIAGILSRSDLLRALAVVREASG